MVGGLLGESCGTSINSCYSRVHISADDCAGGLAGQQSGNFYNSIWNIETSGQSNATGYNQEGDLINVLGATTAEMQMMSTYTDISWDFFGEIVNGTEDIWDINSDLNHGYPYLADLGAPNGIVEQELPKVELLSNLIASPNPFNPETRISFALGEPVEKVILTVYNFRGQRIWEDQIDNVEKGKQSIIWSGQDKLGQVVASGVYLYQVSAGRSTEMGKLVLLK